MCKMDALKYKPKHNQYVNKIHNKHKGIVKLCRVKARVLVDC